MELEIATHTGGASQSLVQATSSQKSTNKPFDSRHTLKDDLDMIIEGLYIGNA